MQTLGKDVRDFLGLLERHGVRYMIARVVRLRRLADVDEHGERRDYWATRSIAERIAEVESLRRLWPEITGDADAPIARVVHKRKLGEPAPAPPPRASPQPICRWNI